MKKLALLILFFTANNLYAQNAYLKLSAGGQPRVNSIIEAEVKNPLNLSASYKAVNKQTGQSAPVQLLTANRILFILPDSLGAADTVTYQLVKSASLKKKHYPTEVLQNEKGLTIKCHGKTVLFYNTAVIQPPAPFASHYARSGFIHPLFSPAGKILTDDFPQGHAHQHGIMMAWTSTRYKGKAHDFWNQHQKTGNVKHIEVVDIQTGPVASIITLNLQHYSLEFGEVLKEQWKITVYPFSKNYIFDIISTQVNTSTDSLFINKYHYGGMAYRGSRQWNRDDSMHFRNKWTILTNEGADLSNADGKPAAWLSASGEIDGDRAGLTVFSFPDNYHYPEPVRVHPVMPYWCFTPAVKGGFTIAPQQEYKYRYRYFVHDGNPDPSFLQSLNNDIIMPVKIIIP